MPIKNPGALKFHDLWLGKFTSWLTDQGFSCEPPPKFVSKRHRWDWGIDIIVNDTVLDLKVFGLTDGLKTCTWASEYSEYRGARPFYPGQLTEFFVHKVGDNFDDWLAAPAQKLCRSYNGGPPFYWKNEVLSMSQLLLALREQTT